MKYKISSDNTRLLKNIFSLTVLQGLNYLFPFLTLLYLVRIVELENYGMLMFAVSIVNYFKLVIDYGFNLSATRAIAINNQNKEEVSNIISSTFAVKFILFAALLVPFCMLINLLDRFKVMEPLLLSYYFSLLGGCLFANWLFLGLEKMKFQVGISFVEKLIYFVLLVMTVKTKDDYFFVPIIQSITFILSGLVTLAIIRYILNIRLGRPKWQDIINRMREGWYIFVSNLSNGFYSNSPTFLLGLLGDNQMVSIYSAAEKIIKLIQLMINPVFQALFPFMSSKFSKNKKNGLVTLIPISKYILGISVLLSLGLLVCADLIVDVTYGKEFLISITLLKLMSLLPVTYAVIHLLGHQVLLTMGYAKDFALVFVIALIVNIPLTIILIMTYGAYGACFGVVVTEILIVLLLCSKIYTLGIHRIT